jgi:hypothetical protein
MLVSTGGAVMARRLAVGALLALTMAACTEGELVGVHIKLEADGGGTITTRTLLEPTEAGPAEARSKGVIWQGRASLILSQGAFKNIAELHLGDGPGDIRFAGDVKSPDKPGVRIRVPRGPDAQWVQLLVPSAEVRKKLTKVYDPTGKKREIAGSIQLELRLPGNVVSSGVLPSARGVEAAHERDRATLVIPVLTAIEKGDELVWDVNWIPH